MSVDDDVRAALAEPDPWWTGRVAGALADTHQEARRRTRRRRAGALAASAAVVIVSGLAWAQLTPPSTESSPADGVATVRTDDEPTPPDAGAQLDGVWTARVTEKQVRRTLAAAGLSEATNTVLGELPDAPLTLRLTFDAGRAELSVAGADEHAYQQLDLETFTLTDDQIAMTPSGSSGVNKYRWERTPSALTLEFLSSTEPAHRGVPAEAFQRTLYTSHGFTLTE